MKLVLRLFGIFPVLTLDVVGLFEIEADEDEDAAHIEGGSAHNFERDFQPLSPTSHHEWEWEDKRRGFGFS